MANKITTETLPENAKKLFELYLQDAGNWSGTPLVSGNVELLGAKEDRALVTYLKRAGLVTTSQDSDNRRCYWLHFTAAGIGYATALGYANTYGGTNFEKAEAAQ